MPARIASFFGIGARSQSGNGWGTDCRRRRAFRLAGNDHDGGARRRGPDRPVPDRVSVPRFESAPDSLATLPLHLTNIATGVIGFFIALTPDGPASLADA